jgi:signal recognition particle receptor subunit beta
MVLFNYSTREITAKIVYYGPGLCGKTTNLQLIHAKMDTGKRGKLLSLATDTDRTLFFDFLPLDLGTIGGFHLRYQLYTVPGQVHYNATRRMVLKGVDAVVFVADSQIEMMENNCESFKNLAENLVENGYEVENVPIVLQANKRDLPNIASPEEIQKAIGGEEYQIFEAVANRGDGVFETLKAIVKLGTAKLKDEFKDDGIEADSVEEVAPAPTPAAPYEPKPLVSDDLSLADSPEEAEAAAGELSPAVGSVAGTGESMPDVSEMEHDEWQVLEEEEKKEKEEKKKSSSEPLPEEPPAEAAAEEVLSSQGKVVEELDLEDLEEFEESGGEASPAVVEADSATGSSDLGGLVEELSREVRLLKEENREIRGMLEGIFVAAGSQIDILRVMRKELSGGENSEPLAEDRPDREGG